MMTTSDRLTADVSRLCADAFEDIASRYRAAGFDHGSAVEHAAHAMGRLSRLAQAKVDSGSALGVVLAEMRRRTR